MSNNDYILDAIKGEPNSLTSIAFNTGVIAERARIIKLLEEHAEQKFADNFDTSKDTCHEDVCDLCANWNGLGVAIALIKGENK